jgi:osmoprotectant transport system ATP-binding protein
MLELRGVTKRFGEQFVLGPIDLRLKLARTSALIGPSGSGKSSVIRLLTGLLRPDTGGVFIDGTPMDASSATALRLRMGYVIQDGGLFPHLSAHDNVTLMARHLGWADDRIAARLQELCELTRLPRERMANFPAQLSGGERQRVSLMRALMLDPDVLLLDEPLAALDPIVRADLQADLRAVFAHLGKTVVLVTHDLGEAGFLGDTLVLLRAGRLVQEGTLTELVRAPADSFVTRFVNAQRSPLESVREGAVTA